MALDETVLQMAGKKSNSDLQAKEPESGCGTHTSGLQKAPPVSPATLVQTQSNIQSSCHHVKQIIIHNRAGA